MLVVVTTCAYTFSEGFASFMGTDAVMSNPVTSYRCVADCRAGMQGLTDRRHVQHESVQTTANDSCRQAVTGGRPPEACVNASSELAIDCKAHEAVTEALMQQSSQQRSTHDSPRQHLCSYSQVRPPSQPQENQKAGNDTAEGSCALGDSNLHPNLCATARTELQAHGQNAPIPDDVPMQNVSIPECTQVRVVG